MKIAIFGGTFDPFHYGHLKLIKYGLKKLKFDKVIVVPNNQNPLKKNKTSASGQKRLEMIKLVLPPKVEVDDYEIKNQGKSYTVKTIKYFKNKFMNDQLFLLVGSDQIPNLKKWKDFQTINNLAKLVFFKTAQSKINSQTIKKYDYIILNNPLWNYRANDYRHGKLNITPPKIQKYIAKNYLYLETICANSLSPSRFSHSLEVAKLACQYAKNLNLDTQKAYYGGLVHDLTKEWTIQEHRQFLRKFKIDDHKYQDYELHSLSASVWVKKVYKLNDKLLINAIKHHTTLNWNLTIWDKIIYAADKLAQGRKWKTIDQNRKLIWENFDLGFQKLVQINYQQLIKKGIQFSPKQIKIYNHFLKR